MEGGAGRLPTLPPRGDFGRVEGSEGTEGDWLPGACARDTTAAADMRTSISDSSRYVSNFLLNSQSVQKSLRAARMASSVPSPGFSL